MYCKEEKIFLKKVLAEWEKGSTFAPAFGRNEGSWKREYGSVKFFESLRPAQDQRRVMRREARNLLEKEHQREHQGGTRDSEQNKKEKQ